MVSIAQKYLGFVAAVCFTGLVGCGGKTSVPPIGITNPSPLPMHETYAEACTRELNAEIPLGTPYSPAIKVACHTELSLQTGSRPLDLVCDKVTREIVNRCSEIFYCQDTSGMFNVPIQAVFDVLDVTFPSGPRFYENLTDGDVNRGSLVLGSTHCTPR